MLPHVDRDGAIVVAEKVKTAISSRLIRGGFGSLKLTTSLGISALSSVGKDIGTLLAQADAAMYHAKHQGRNGCVSWGSSPADSTMAQRRRVLKAGSIIFNDRRSTMDCTVKSLGLESAGISVHYSLGIPSEFILSIKADGFEANCQVIAQDHQHLEVAFRWGDGSAPSPQRRSTRTEHLA